MCHLEGDEKDDEGRVDALWYHESGTDIEVRHRQRVERRAGASASTLSHIMKRSEDRANWKEERTVS